MTKEGPNKNTEDMNKAGGREAVTGQLLKKGNTGEETQIKSGKVRNDITIDIDKLPLLDKQKKKEDFEAPNN